MEWCLRLRLEIDVQPVDLIKLCFTMHLHTLHNFIIQKNTVCCKCSIETSFSSPWLGKRGQLRWLNKKMAISCVTCWLTGIYTCTCHWPVLSKHHLITFSFKYTVLCIIVLIFCVLLHKSNAIKQIWARPCTQQNSYSISHFVVRWLHSDWTVTM